MAGEYLDTSYKFDTGMLIEPIRKKSTVRQISPVRTVLKPEDLQVEIETVTDDFNIMMNLEPYATHRSNQFLTRVTKDVGILSAELAYEWDELQRINRSKLPFDKRIRDLGWAIADIEDALALAVTTTGVLDGDAIPFLQGGTATAFDLSSYATLKTSIATYIGTMGTRYGNLKLFPLQFAYNAKFFSTVLGLSNSTTDFSGLKYIDDQLRLFGGPGSGIISSPNLGCDVALSEDVLTVTVEADETCALFARANKHYEIYASPLDQRPRPTNKQDGYSNKIVERWFPYVHDAQSILYDIDATP